MSYYKLLASTKNYLTLKEMIIRFTASHYQYWKYHLLDIIGDFEIPLQFEINQQNNFIELVTQLHTHHQFSFSVAQNQINVSCCLLAQKANPAISNFIDNTLTFLLQNPKLHQQTVSMSKFIVGLNNLAVITKMVDFFIVFCNQFSNRMARHHSLVGLLKDCITEANKLKLSSTVTHLNKYGGYLKQTIQQILYELTMPFESNISIVEIKHLQRIQAAKQLKKQTAIESSMRFIQFLSDIITLVKQKNEELRKRASPKNAMNTAVTMMKNAIAECHALGLDASSVFAACYRPFYTTLQKQTTRTSPIVTPHGYRSGLFTYRPTLPTLSFPAPVYYAGSLSSSISSSALPTEYHQPPALGLKRKNNVAEIESEEQDYHTPAKQGKR